MKNTSRVAGLNVLDGRITADAIKAVANTSASSRSINSSPKGSEFVNLEIAGNQMVDVAPNTKVNLPSIGYVIVNEQKRPAAGSTARTQVNGLHVFVTRNNTLGVPVGTEIIIAHADSTAVRF